MASAVSSSVSPPRERGPARRVALGSRTADPSPARRPSGPSLTSVDPVAGVGAAVGPAWLYWTTSFAVVAGGLTGAVFMLKPLQRDGRGVGDDPTRLEGLATRREVQLVAGVRQLRQRGVILRPLVEKPVASDLGLFLGTSRRVACFASVEDSMVLLGPPRSGKGMNLVIPFILDAPGAVVTTSTRPDNLAATITARQQRGPVGVFDPQGLAVGVAGGLRWSPVRGCENPQTAMMRAAALCSGAAGAITDANFWQRQTEVVVRCLLQAAAVDDRTVSDLYRWSVSPDEAKEAVELLKASTARDAPVGEHAGMRSSGSSRERSPISGRSSVASSRRSRILGSSCSSSPSPGEEFEPAAFLRECGTLYLLGTELGGLRQREHRLGLDRGHRRDRPATGERLHWGAARSAVGAHPRRGGQLPAALARSPDERGRGHGNHDGRGTCSRSPRPATDGATSRLRPSGTRRRSRSCSVARATPATYAMLPS